MTWSNLPFSSERLDSVVHFGNGKDAELTLIFADGRRIVLPTNAVRIQIDGGVVVETSAWDDVSLRTEYRAPGLTFHSGRIGCPVGDGDDLVTLFRDEVRTWISAGCREELTWTVKVEVSLTSFPVGSLTAQDDR